VDNSKKIILDLCGGTGAWSKPYKDAGYDVRLITLPEYDVRDYFNEIPKKVHGILAAPPCTEFSLAKGSRKRDFDSAMEIVSSCLCIIWEARIKHGLKWWCLENPRGFLRQFLGKPPHTIHYWWYGDSLDKPTDLWGYYNSPKQRYYQPPSLIQKIENTPGGTQENRNKYRAITPPGFAQEFFKSNP
jgi:hypothetical protein